MDDREMLELAALAAGVLIDKSPHNGGGDGNDGFDVAGNAVLDWHNNRRWNTLADDGDALRLAVKLRIDVKHYEDHVVAWYGDYFGTGVIPNGDDPAAATRLAITMAAAEIGKTMKGGA